SRIAEPFRADAHTGEETVDAVDRQQFAVIARDPAERFAQPRRVEDAYRAAGASQGSPKAAARLTEAAEPVDDHGHHDAGPCALHQRIPKRAADLVVTDDVILEQHAPPRAADRREP